MTLFTLPFSFVQSDRMHCFGKVHTINVFFKQHYVINCTEAMKCDVLVDTKISVFFS